MKYVRLLNTWLFVVWSLLPLVVKKKVKMHSQIYIVTAYAAFNFTLAFYVQYTQENSKK